MELSGPSTETPLSDILMRPHPPPVEEGNRQPIVRPDVIRVKQPGAGSVNRRTVKEIPSGGHPEYEKRDTVDTKAVALSIKDSPNQRLTPNGVFSIHDCGWGVSQVQQKFLW